MPNEHRQYAYTGMPADVFNLDKILCPRCEAVLEVHHFEWAVITCIDCHQGVPIEEFLVLNYDDDAREEQLV